MTERVTVTVVAVAETGTVPARSLNPRSTLFRKSVFGFVVILSIWSSALLRYCDKDMLKGWPAMTVWTGFEPVPDADGVALGTPLAGDPEAEGGNAIDVGTTGGDTLEVPATLAGGERGGSDAVEGLGEEAPGADGTTDGGRLGKPLVGPTGDVNPKLGSEGTSIDDPPTGGIDADN